MTSAKSARHVANKQRERIRDGQMIGRMAG